MESALIALVGVLVGILCNEHFRRRNRIEFYSQKVFEKRLKIHEDLFTLFQEGYTVAAEVMENEELSEEERHEIISSVILPLCQYTDKHELYLDKYLTVQVASAYMGAEDIMGYADELTRESERSKIQQSYLKAKSIIIEESGASEVLKHFKTISKSKPDSNIIRYMKSLEKNKV